MTLFVWQLVTVQFILPQQREQRKEKRKSSDPCFQADRLDIIVVSHRSMFQTSLRLHGECCCTLRIEWGSFHFLIVKAETAMDRFLCWGVLLLCSFEIQGKHLFYTLIIFFLFIYFSTNMPKWFTFVFVKSGYCTITLECVCTKCVYNKWDTR